MKKSIALMLSVALTAGILAGCSSGNSSSDSSAASEASSAGSSSTEASSASSTSEASSESSTSTASENSFTLYAWGDAHWDQYVNLQEEFNSSHSDYQLTMMQENSLTDLLMTRASQNDLPDMFFLSPYNGVYDWASGDWLLDLSDEEWVEGIPDSILESVSYDGKVYAFPYSVTYTGLFYNIDIFEEVGISVPQTVTEFADACQKLADAGYTPVAIGGGGSAAWVYYQFWNSIVGAALGDGVLDFVDSMNAGEASFSDVPNIDKVGEMLQMAMIDYNDPNPMDCDYSAMISEFAEGTAAMYWGSTSSTGDVIALNPDMNMGLMGYPVSEDPADVRINYDVEIAVPIAANSENAEGAKELLNYLSDPDTGAKNIVSQSRVPINDEVEMEAPLTGQSHTDAMEYVSEGTYTPWLNWLTPTGFNDDFAADLQNYVLGTTTFEELLDIADSKWASYAAQ